jgi:hypothetical protein
MSMTSHFVGKELQIEESIVALKENGFNLKNENTLQILCIDV